MKKENKRETEARLALEAVLEPGEELLAFTGGAIAGAFRNEPVRLGLTPQRIILLPWKRREPKGEVIRLWREYVKSIQYSGAWDRLKLRFEGDTLTLQCGNPFWKRRAKELARLHGEMPTVPQMGAAGKERASQVAVVLQRLGLIAAAQGVLKGAGPTADATGPHQQYLAEKRIALRVGAGFLLCNSALLTISAIGLTLLKMPFSFGTILSAVIDVIFGVNLWKGRTEQWTNWAIIRAVLGLALFGVPALVQGQMLEFIGQAAYSSALILVLAGKATRTKTYIAAAIYLVGFLGPLAILILWPFIDLLLSIVGV
jgi:hypothetical protein